MSDETTEVVDARLEALEKALGIIMSVIGRHPDVHRELVRRLHAFESLAHEEKAHPDEVDTYRRLAEWMSSVHDGET